MQTLREVAFTDKDEATIRGMFDDAVRYVLAGDWAKWAGMYAEDGVFKPASGPEVHGRSDILAWAKALPKAEALAFQDVKVWGEANLAYGTSGYTFKLKDLPLDTGTHLVVFRRTTGGPWKLVAANVSSNPSQASGK
jgi:ketosteroid isomerase-like protein